MHEFSIATALVELVGQYAPAGSTVRSVRVRAGAMRSIEPMAMQWAWQAATADSPYHDATLELNVLPWTLQCTQCGREWSADEPYEPCTCGSGDTQPIAGAELQLMSLEVDEPDACAAAPPRAKHAEGD